MFKGLILRASALALVFTLSACSGAGEGNSDSADKADSSIAATTVDAKAEPKTEPTASKSVEPASEQGFKLSSNTLENKFKVTVYPQSGKTEIGGYHNWVIQVQDLQGKAVEGARMSVGGGMEAHGHGLPSKPQVTESLGEGKYLIEGMQFNMSGRWTLLFVVQTATEMDRVRFDFDLAF